MADPTAFMWNTNSNKFMRQKPHDVWLERMQAQFSMVNVQIYSPGLCNPDAIDYGGLGDFETYSHLLEGLGGTKSDSGV